MNLIDVLIPLVPGILLVAFPQILTPKEAPPDETVKKKKRLRQIGYVLVGVAALYLFIMLAQPHAGH
jgi:hypothetical protein